MKSLLIILAAILCIHQSSAKPFNVQGQVCDECKLVVGYMAQLYEDPSFQGGYERAVEAMESFCDNLTQSFVSAKCHEILVKINSTDLEPFLSDPEAACEQVKLCQKPSDNSKIAHLLSSNSNGVLCDGCQQVVGDLKAQLNNATAIQQLLDTLEEACAFLGPWKAECLEFIEVNVTAVVNQTLSVLDDPLELCTEAGFCKPSKTGSIITNLVSMVRSFFLKHRMSANSNGRVCDACKQEVGEWKSALEDPALQDKVKETLETLCSHSHLGPLQDKCTEYVDKFTPEALQEILSALADPAQLCSQYGFCK